MNNEKPQFSTKLLSGNSLILVECPGFDSEIFSAQIKNNRIQFVNVIESRRCCSTENGLKVQVISDLLVKNLNKTNSKAKQVQELSGFSPEIVRRCHNPVPVLHRQSSFMINNHYTPSSTNMMKKVVNNSEKFKVVHLFRNSTNNSPKQPVKLLSIPKKRNENYCESSFLNKSFHPVAFNALSPSFNKNQSTPLSNHNRRNLNSINMTITPLQKSNFKIYNKKNVTPKRTTNAPGTITKWRKCITPLRTYSRKKYGVIDKNNILRLTPEAPRIIPIEKTCLPDYLRNQTQGYEGDGHIIVKRYKIIVDDKISISPKSFKSQLHDKSYAERNRFRLPRTRTTFFASKYGGPYNMLNRSCRNKCMARDLKKMFRKRCIRKVNQTHKKYLKLVGKLPPLETKKIEQCVQRENRLEPRKLNI